LIRLPIKFEEEILEPLGYTWSKFDYYEAKRRDYIRDEEIASLCLIKLIKLADCISFKQYQNGRFILNIDWFPPNKVYLNPEDALEPTTHFIEDYDYNNLIFKAITYVYDEK
jgi:hypothetical protein